MNTTNSENTANAVNDSIRTSSVAPNNTWHNIGIYMRPAYISISN
jgi:hypothetical protein